MSQLSKNYHLSYLQNLAIHNSLTIYIIGHRLTLLLLFASVKLYISTRNTKKIKPANNNTYPFKTASRLPTSVVVILLTSDSVVANIGQGNEQKNSWNIWQKYNLIKETELSIVHIYKLPYTTVQSTYTI